MELLEKKEQLNELIDKSSSIFIMGHRYLDLDALGGSIGVYEYVKAKGKNPTIIINDRSFEKGVKKALDGFKNKYDLPVEKNRCPKDGHSKREYVKELLNQINKDNPGAKKKMFSALCSSTVEGWQKDNGSWYTFCCMLKFNRTNFQDNDIQSARR